MKLMIDGMWWEESGTMLAKTGRYCGLREKEDEGGRHARKDTTTRTRVA